MKQNATRRRRAFTRTELIVVIVLLLVVLVVILLASVATGIRRGVSRTECPYTLREIGVAYRIWADDHKGRFPASESVSNGGWKELLTNADQGAICWTN
jgi:competence protein ComGC